MQISRRAYEKWNSPNDSESAVADRAILLNVLGDVGRLIVGSGSSCFDK